MTSVSSEGREAARRRRQTTVAIKESMRDLRIQLARLQHSVGTRLELRDTDLDCLDLIGRHGPLGPSALARLAGVHPATLTGILDRLERAGWIARDRDPADRRAVTVRIVRDRAAEIFDQYAGMNVALDRICASYDAAQLDVLADFLRRATEAGRAATESPT
jgi:DNA-binding MarR family transcriptional regulator